ANQTHRIGALHVSGKIGGEWNRQTATRSTLNGDLAVKTGDVGEAARYAALFGLSSPWIVTSATGPMDASVKLGGIFTDPRFTGVANSPGVDVPSIGLTALTTNFDVSTEAVHLSGIDATISGASGGQGGTDGAA